MSDKVKQVVREIIDGLEKIGDEAGYEKTVAALTAILSSHIEPIGEDEIQEYLDNNHLHSDYSVIDGVRRSIRWASTRNFKANLSKLQPYELLLRPPDSLLGKRCSDIFWLKSDVEKLLG